MLIGLGLFVLGLVIGVGLTWAILRDKIQEILDENKNLKRKSLAAEISKIRKAGDYNTVTIDLLGIESNSFRPVVGNLEIKAEELSDEIAEGEIMELYQ